ncbi:MAG: protein-L-isoaspartate(D-aspartate) O-methyltransferase [Bacteroidales bacterium]|jgi:protein-L-isoaspartate(D-aspartate) O-methyltransferase
MLKKFIAGFFLLIITCPATGKQYEQLRRKMVRDQIQARGVTHRATLQAMRSVERHLFVDSLYKDLAYEDTPLPIGYNQTISQPFMVAYMTSLINPQPHYRVLEIGTGSGYQAAVLSGLTDSVFTIEIVPELGNMAKSRLKDLGYDNVVVFIGDGYHGIPDKAPFDAIVVTAGAEHIPPALVEQLADGGKMVIPVGPVYRVQSLLLVEKKKGKITTENLIPVRFVPFTR